MRIELLVSNGEVTVNVDGSEVAFSNVDDALAYVRRIISDSNCVRDSWYIRVPLSRILDILSYASTSESRDVRLILVNYLRSRGLSESNIRVIQPTLQALGLVNNGEFTGEAVKIGELYRRGMLSECANVMIKLAQGNCMLRSLLSNYKPGDPDSLRILGLRRRDEIKYTMQLLDFITSGGLLGCVDLISELSRGGCVKSICPCCIKYIAFYVLSRLPLTKLVNYLDLPNSGYAPVINEHGVALMNPGSGDVITVVTKVAQFNQANYTPGLRALVDSLEQELRGNGVNRAIIMVPFTIANGDCGVGKIYVATYLNGAFTYAKIYEFREFNEKLVVV